jgi:hypothetical protein
MSAPWTSFAAPAASSQAVLSILAPGGGQVVRLRTLAASLAAATSVSATLQISDGSGTVIFSVDMALPAAGGVTTVMPGVQLDYRASAGNSMVVGFSAGASGVTQKVSAAGDFVQVGVPAFASPIQA